MRTFHIKTWGCQMNQADTEKIVTLLESLGYQEAEDIDQADLIILNTCSVRQRAEDKVLGQARHLSRLKEMRKESLNAGRKAGRESSQKQSLKQGRSELCIVLTGCMAQRWKRSECDEEDRGYVRRLKERTPWIDYYMKIGDLEGLEHFLTGFSKHRDHMEFHQSRSSAVTAYVPISEGCDNFCTYCVVPFSRGTERSRDYGAIVGEMEELVGQGYKLITLLGQNVNSWTGVHNGKKITFADLLDKLSSLQGEYWLTFLTSHPKDFGKAMVDVISKNDRICKYLNLPVQSGSDSVLERMNRGYTRDEYLEKVNLLRGRVPDVRLSTDIIVGFPGETKKDFSQTYTLFKDVRFGMAYISEYSPRSSSASSVLKDSVSRKEKRRRREKIDRLLSDILHESNKQCVGKVMRVLILEDYLGKTNDLRDVKFEDSVKENIGEFVDAEVVDASAGGLVARLAV